MLPLKRMGWYFLATLTLLLTAKLALRPNEKNSYRVYTPRACTQLKPGEQMTLAEAHAIIQEAWDAWNSDSQNANQRIYVLYANPGESITIPLTLPVGTFPQDAKAGMTIPFTFGCQVIILNLGMKPESLVQSFFHELGHAQYNRRNPEVKNEIDSQGEAFKFSLESLAACHEELAYREAAEILEMPKTEPDKSAVARIASDPIWKKYWKKYSKQQ